MKAFIYNGRKYLRILPAKTLCRSTTIWEVINRGDIFAVDIETSIFTVIPGNAQVEHCDVTVVRTPSPAQSRLL